MVKITDSIEHNGLEKAAFSGMLKFRLLFTTFGMYLQENYIKI